ncbi:MAG: diguanylate cyclase domain-containing protein [Gammaproteobacteria bacterium]
MNNEPHTQHAAHEVLLGNSRTELIVGSVAAALIAAMIWADSKTLAVLVWLGVIQSVYGLRFFVTRRLNEKIEELKEKIVAQMRWGLLATGLLWGFGAAANIVMHGMVWPTAATLVTVAVLSVLVLGTYLGQKSLVVPFVLVTSLPIAGAGMLLLQRETIVVAISSLVFMAAISAAAKYVDRIINSLYVSTSERDQYYSELKNSEQEVKRLRVGVKTNSEKREALETELTNKESELQLTKGKAEALSLALERVSPYDAESGLLNGKKFSNVLDREWSRMLRQELPLTLIHIGIDSFDDYAGTYGKIAKEAAVRKISDLIKDTGNRPGDVAARIDTAKFALLLPEADHKNGERLADELRAQVRNLNIPNANATMHSAVTISVGAATVIPNSDLTLEQMLSRVDSALYEAQFQGGDKVVRYRTMNAVRLERWNREAEGDFSPEGLLQKLAVWGYEAQARTLNPGEYHPDRRVQVDMVDAIVQGRLKITLEGESRTLGVGDCLFLPKGVVTSIEVVGDRPVVCLEALQA